MKNLQIYFILHVISQVWDKIKYDFIFNYNRAERLWLVDPCPFP